MDAIAFFHLRYDDLHGPVTDQRMRTLAEPAFRLRPHGLNSVAWLLWHVARCEDVGVNRLVVDRPQVLDDGEWPGRMNVHRRDIGTGMTSAEVDELSARVDVAALLGYWDAVGARTDEVVSHLRAEDLSRPIDRARLRRVVAEEGVLGPQALQLEEAWRTKPNRGWFLAQLALTHTWAHIYDIDIVRGFLWSR